MGYIEDLRKIVGHRPLILTGSVVVVLNESNEILLQERTFPKGKWGLPGGLMELGESTEDTARREVLEETGLQVGDLHLINVYSGPDHFTVAQNGDEFYVVTTAYFTNQFSGALKNDDPAETMRLEFFDPYQLPEDMIGSHRTVLKEYIHKYLEKKN